mgnify:CR=1 FL=1
MIENWWSKKNMQLNAGKLKIIVSQTRVGVVLKIWKCNQVKNNTKINGICQVLAKKKNN